MNLHRRQNDDPWKIPVAYLLLGWEHNRKAVIDFFHTAKNMANWVIDANHLWASSKLDWLISEHKAALRRGVKLHNITDITPENLSLCKERLSHVTELRHLSRVGVVCGVNDFQFIAMAPSSLASPQVEDVQFIQSDTENMVKLKQSIFETLWNKATPALQRIEELESHSQTETDSSKMLEKELIDRMYICIQCKEQFIFSYEVALHKRFTGHTRFREYPIV